MLSARLGTTAALALALGMPLAAAAEEAPVRATQEIKEKIAAEKAENASLQEHVDELKASLERLAEKVGDGESIGTWVKEQREKLEAALKDSGEKVGEASKDTAAETLKAVTGAIDALSEKVDALSKVVGTDETSKDEPSPKK